MWGVFGKYTDNTSKNTQTQRHRETVSKKKEQHNFSARRKSILRSNRLLRLILFEDTALNRRIIWYSHEHSNSMVSKFATCNYVFENLKFNTIFNAHIHTPDILFVFQNTCWERDSRRAKKWCGNHRNIGIDVSFPFCILNYFSQSVPK